MKRLCASILPLSLLLLVAACHSNNNGILVPDVVGLTVAAATTKLQPFDLKVGTQTTASSATVPAGEISSQNPMAGATVAYGSSVDIVVSTGPAAAAAAVPAASVALSASVAATAVVPAAAPAAGLSQGSDGNFYGISASGGANRGQGVFYRVTPSGGRTVLYSFGSGNEDAIQPDAMLLQGADGNFYGTSATGGAYGAGTVFRITPAGVETVLYAFPGGTPGAPASPAGGLIQGADGNLYGATRAGGTHGTGVVFRLTPAGALSVLYSFGPVNGADAAATLR
jgi:uncharacterized repeat protein (TIGR03803 family)